MVMNEEENEAIKILNNAVENNCGISFMDIKDNLFKIYDAKPIKVVLDIISNKDKEIEQLKERIADLEASLFEAEEYIKND